MKMRAVHLVQIGVGTAVGLLLGGVATASAAHLGTITAEKVGTSATVVAACDTDGITASWDSSTTSPVWLGNVTMANSTFNVTRLNLTGVATACNGQTYKIVVANSSGTALQSITGTIAGAPNITFTIPATDSKSIAQIIILMYG